LALVKKKNESGVSNIKRILIRGHFKIKYLKKGEITGLC